MFITRRQFLKYCAASAAALGLSQSDLLKLEQAMATPVTGCLPGNIPGLGIQCPRIVWIAGANCSGCATGLLNFVAPQAGYSPLGYALSAETWTETEPALGAAYGLVGALDGFDIDGIPGNEYTNGLLDIGDVAVNVVSIDYAYIVAAAAGDVLNDYLFTSVIPDTGKWVLMVEGAIQIKKEGLYCRVFEVPPGHSMTIPTSCGFYRPYNLVPPNKHKPGFWQGKELCGQGVTPTDPHHPHTGTPLAEGDEVTMADATAYLASHPNCLAVIAFGTCATWGGIPGAKGNRTGAISVEEWLVKKNGLSVPILNVPGCPPHPDWLIAPVVDLILRLKGTFPGGVGAWLANIDISLCTNKPKEESQVSPDGLIKENRHKLTWLPLFPPGKVFCIPENGNPATPNCPRHTDLSPPQAMIVVPSDPNNPPPGAPDGLGGYHVTGRDAVSYPNGRCLRGVGCNGWKTGSTGAKADCPTRMFNTHTNWCCGNNYPCQGCTDPNFPDGCQPFFQGEKGKYRGVR